MPNKSTNKPRSPAPNSSMRKYLKKIATNNKATFKKDKRFDEAFRKQTEEFKKQQDRYDCLHYTDSHFSNITKQFVIGQDDAIDTLSYIIYHNMHQNMMDDFFGIKPKLYSAVVVGPSGCGKTASISKLAELYGVPYAKYNATPLTSGGFVGKDVEAMLFMLIQAAHGNIELAQYGILYIDEIDKKASAPVSNTSGRDVNGTSVQEELLKFLEPSIIDLGKGQKFDTSHLTIIMSGRFLGIDKIRKKRVSGKSSIGFNINSFRDYDLIPVDYEDDDFNEFDSSLSEKYTHQDIINFGFLDEFVGRIFAVLEYTTLSKTDLIDVILAKDSPLQHFVESIKTKNQTLYIDMAIYERMAEAAYSSPTGARCLNDIIQEFLIPADKDFMFNYHPGIMEYDADGNYSSLFETSDRGLRYSFIPGKRLLRRIELQKNIKKIET